MQKSPVKEKDVVGIPEESYASVRHLASVEEKEHWKKKSKDKKTKPRIPQFKVGERVVCIDRSFYAKTRYYYVVEVVDFIDDGYRGFDYFGILRKTTNEKFFDRIGRMATFGEDPNTWSHKWVSSNVPEDSIKW